MRGMESRISQFVTQSAYYDNPYQIIGHLVQAIERLEHRVTELERSSSNEVLDFEYVDEFEGDCPVDCSQDNYIGMKYGVKIRYCSYCNKELEQVE